MDSSSSPPSDPHPHPHGHGHGHGESHDSGDDVDVAASAAAAATASAAEQLRRRWKGKDKDAELPSLVPLDDDGGTLTLLKLPVDILRLILQEVAQPNEEDLLGLLLVNSTLYNLVIPYVYSSFSIVWPDSEYFSVGEDVDALTSGLSSLALGSRFARTMHRLHGLPPPRKPESHARFIKNFKINNGPTKWVNDYSIANEAGMMLNTLVAMALPKMVNLESFKWDMPTGLSSNVFMALASLEDEGPGNLDEVWVRWHDDPPSSSSSSSSRIFHNGHAPPPPPGVPQPPPVPPSPPSSNPESIGSQPSFRLLTPYQRVAYRESNVEYPTYSILPALRSIAALDVDQVSYLDELAILIQRSKPTLRELRVSIATKSANDDFTQIKGDQHGLRQYDPEARWPGESRIGDRRLGGVLGVILARVYDLRRNHPRPRKGGTESDAKQSSSSSIPPPTTSAPASAGPGLGSSPLDHESNTQITDLMSKPATPTPDDGLAGVNPPWKATRAESSEPAMDVDCKLALECLELARLPLHTTLCANAFDWTVLTTLTILGCDHQDRLWRALREQFRPIPPSQAPRRGSGRRQSKEAPIYHLKLKNVHVDVTTFALIHFLKETLAPNSLEVLFLHDRRRTSHPVVPIAPIFTGVVKRHHASLKKLLLDSSHPDRLHHHGDIRRMYWPLKREMIQYITSGRMGALRELSASIPPKEWHTVLQRLPNIPKLTALHILSLGRDSSTPDSMQLGHQIVDVITLRPEIRLCFIGIKNLCFQIVESQGPAGSDSGTWSSDSMSLPSISSDMNPPSVDGALDDDDDDDHVAEESDDESQSSRRQAENDWTTLGRCKPESNKSYRLRKIFFYDEKVAIFQARHGTL
ncbi:F-box domain-containing protein [Dactylonectria estremocensis]|uniref:F-box domain-containing protein n=1 Tax=Dactylonectria estremocensis TaxID=1079267 RepID=A0A9P9FLJ7_9HYPO|nr:F-box domain-containing protein [Dactylonectria estremocensis]